MMIVLRVASALLFLAFLIAFISPKWANKNNKGKPITRKHTSIGAVVCLLLFFAFGGFGAATTTGTPPTAPSGDVVNIGQKGHLIENGDSDVVVAVSKDALDSLEKAVSANDNIGFQQLFATGKVYTVPAKTTALVLNYGGFLDSDAEVRIMDTGNHYGEAVWVSTDWVKQ